MIGLGHLVILCTPTAPALVWITLWVKLDPRLAPPSNVRVGRSYMNRHHSLRTTGPFPQPAQQYESKGQHSLATTQPLKSGHREKKRRSGVSGLPRDMNGRGPRHTAMQDSSVYTPPHTSSSPTTKNQCLHRAYTTTDYGLRRGVQPLPRSAYGGSGQGGRP